jgi:thiol-disulfide isomerase/thioredoxin
MLLKTNPLLRLSHLLAVTAFTFLAAAPAAAFDLVDTQGRAHRLADYQGKYVVLNFWATWCVPCIQEIPEIAAFHRERPGVVVIGVAVDAENPAKVKQFAAKAGHDYPLVMGDERVEKQLGEQRALPTTRIYDPLGKVIYDRVGKVDRKLLEEATKTRAAGVTASRS